MSQGTVQMPGCLDVLSGGDIVQVGLDAGALDLLDLLHDLVVDAVLIHDVAVGVGHGDDLAAQLGSLLVGVDSNVAGAGDHDALALKALAGVGQHLLGKVAQAVAGSLGAGEGAAEGDALAGQNAGVLVADALYWPNRKPISRPPTPISPAARRCRGRCGGTTRS